MTQEVAPVMGSNRLISARWFGRSTARLPSNTLTILTVICMPGRQAGMASENPLPVTDSSGRGRALHFSQLEPAEALLESIEKLPRIEILLDVGFTQRRDLPDALSNFEGGLARLLFNGTHCGLIVALCSWFDKLT